jgi:hypothetical protein
LDAIVSNDSRPRKASKAKKKRKIKQEEPDETAPEGVRRSRRIQVKEENFDNLAEVETEEDRFLNLLGGFIISGECPKCSRIFEKGHRRHLLSCRGPVTEATKRVKLDREILQDLNPEEKADERKKMLKRLSALSMAGLEEFNDGYAKIGVYGSTGRRYTVTFSDAKNDGVQYKDKPRKCECIDSKCRRRDCKHICLVMQHLGIDLDIPPDEFNKTWRESVEENMKLLADEGDGYIEYTVPEGKNEAIGRKFLET